KRAKDYERWVSLKLLKWVRLKVLVTEVEVQVELMDARLHLIMKTLPGVRILKRKIVSITDM
ncbi:hypothetical protein, partial [Xanthomonas vasicola]|uniref:hypothetical protein n=1 Tax=Xanthomonas vasicola TaxID=56459 RepID=UPI001C46B8DF